MALLFCVVTSRMWAIWQVLSAFMPEPPIQMVLLAVVTNSPAMSPTKILNWPAVRLVPALPPTAVLESALLVERVPAPTPVLKFPVVFKNSERQPTPVFPVPVTSLMSASSPRNALKLLPPQPLWQTACACGESAKHANTGRMVTRDRKSTRL